MKDSARYAKTVQWSQEDQCYIGRAQDLMYGGCHGDDEQAVFAELCEIVEEVIEALRQNGEHLPPASARYDYSRATVEQAETAAA